MDTIRWWIDRSYIVLLDLKGHYGGMTLHGKGAAASKLIRHRINLRSYTESDIIGVGDHMTGVLWTLRFLGGQGFKVKNTIVYQDNQIAILMERNGKYLCGNKTCHIYMRCFSSLTASNRRRSASNTEP